MPEYKAGEIFNSQLTVVGNTNPPKTKPTYEPGEIYNNLSNNSPRLNKALYQGAITDLSQSGIYGDTDKYSVPEIEDDSRWQNYNKALNQNIFEQAGAFANQAILGEIVGGTIQGIGALGGIFDSIFTKDKQDFNNVVTDLGRSLQEWTQEVTPIYRENPYTSFDVTDTGWWFGNGVSVVSSLSMLIPARGTMFGLNLLAKGLRAEKAVLGLSKGLNKIKNLDKIDDAGNILRKGEEIFSNKLKYFAQVGGTGALMRHMENFREAGQVSLSTKKEALDSFNKLSDTEWNTWQKENAKVVKEYSADMKGQEVTKENLAEYIAAKSGWETYSNNWANIVFDIVQVMPLFRGMKATTRGAGMGVRVAKAEAEAVGKTLTKSELMAARLQPLGNVLKRQWTEGIEEMINGISEKEGMRLGRILMGQEKEVDGFTDRLFEDYLQDPHIWEQGFWGVLGGITFETVSTGVQDKYNKYKNKTYQSTKDKIETEIQDRKIAVANFVASKKAIEEGYDIYGGQDKITKKYQPLTGTPEEIALKKEEAYTRLVNDVGTELGLTASRAGNVDGLLEFVKSSYFTENVAKESGVEKEKAISISNELTKSILNAEKAYTRAYNSLKFTNLPQYVQDIIIPHNIRDTNRIKVLENNKLKNDENIAKFLQNSDLYETLTQEQKDNIQGYINSTAAKGMIASIERFISLEENQASKKVYEEAYSKIKEGLIEKSKEATTLNSNTFRTYGIDVAIIDEIANKHAIDFHLSTTKTNMHNRTFTTQVEEAMDAKMKEHKALVQKEYDSLVSKINLNQEWANVEKDWKTIEQLIDAQLPNKKGTKIDYKKDLATLKQKHNNLQNGTTPITPTFNVSIEEQELINLGVDIFSSTTPGLRFLVDSMSNDDLTAQEKIDIIDENLTDTIENADKETQDKILTYFNNKTNLLRLYDVNVETTNTQVTPLTNAKVQEAANEDLNPNSETNTEEASKLEDLTIDANENGHINLFVSLMDNINDSRDENGAIKIEDELAEQVAKVFSLRLGSSLKLQIDTANPQYSKDSTILDVPVVLADENGNSLGLYINNYQYLQNEMLMLINLSSLSDEKLQELVTLAKNNDLVNFVNKLQEYVIKDIDATKSHGSLERIQKHFIKILTFNTEENLQLNKVSINAWKSKISRDYRANHDIRNKLRQSDQTTTDVMVVKKTSGDLVISRNESGNIVYNSVTDIFTDNVNLFVGRGNFLVNGENGEQEVVGKVYEGAVYTLVKEHNNKVPVLFLPNTINGLTEKSKKNADQISNYLTNLVFELVDAIKSNDTVLQKDIKNRIDAYTFANRTDENSFNYFEWFNNSIKFNTTKGKYQLVITDKNVYIKDRTDLSKNLNDKSTIFLDNTTSITSKAGIETLRSLLGDRARNIQIKNLDRSFDMRASNTYTPYLDPATNITYPSYKQYLLENDVIITRHNHIVDSKGNHVSYFTNKAENNSSNWKTSRPLIINVVSTVKTEPVKKDIEVSEEQQRVEKLKDVIRNSKTFAEVHANFQFEQSYEFLYTLADDLGITFNNEVLKNEGKMENVRGQFFNNVISVFDKFFTQGTDINRQITLNHEILHGVIEKSIQNFSQQEKDVLYGKLKEFITDLLDKTKNNQELETILSQKETINGIELDVFTENDKNYIKELLDFFRNRVLNSTDKTKVDEVITYAFSSPVFAKFLNNVKSDLSVEEFNEGVKEKSFWSKLKEILIGIIKGTVKIFDGKVDKLSQLNKILDEYIDVFQENRSITEAVEGEQVEEEITEEVAIEETLENFINEVVEQEELENAAEEEGVTVDEVRDKVIAGVIEDFKNEGENQTTRPEKNSLLNRIINKVKKAVIIALITLSTYTSIFSFNINPKTGSLDQSLVSISNLKENTTSNIETIISILPEYQQQYVYRGLHKLGLIELKEEVTPIINIQEVKEEQAVDKVINEAEKYLGEREKGDSTKADYGSKNLGFNNKSFENLMINNGFKKGYAWCSIFIKSVLSQRVSDKNIGTLNKLFNPSVNGTFNNIRNAKDSNYKVVTEKDLKVGSIVFYTNDDNSAGHIVIVKTINKDGTFTTVEGNSNDKGDREGYEVVSKTRTLNNEGLNLLGIVNINYNALTEENLNFYTEYGKVRDNSGGTKTTDSLIIFQRQSTNNTGFVYVPSPSKQNLNNDEVFNGVTGVAHFLITQKGEDLTSNTTSEELQKAKERVLKEYKKENPNGWIPTFTKEKSGNVILRFKKLNDVNDSDIVVTRLYQRVFGDLDFNDYKKSKAGRGGNKAVKDTVRKQGVDQLQFTNLNSYGRISGGSAIFIFEYKGQTIIKEAAGSIGFLQQIGNSIVTKYGINPKKITMGFFDAGSYAAKPSANSNNKISTEQYKGYNAHSNTGAGLMIPVQPKFEEVTIKEGVQELFEVNPELTTIGTTEQYSQYLNTIFPDSKVKDIVYHGTKAEFEEFNTRPDKTSGSRYSNEAAFFTTDLELANQYGKNVQGKTISALVNLINPKTYKKKSEGLDLTKPRSFTEEVRNNLQNEGFDGALNTRYDNEIAVFESEQIHILGSKKDIQGFKDYVNKPKSEEITNNIEQPITLTTTSYLSSKIIEDTYTEIINKLIENQTINKVCE
jgi:hypothetical protein